MWRIRIKYRDESTCTITGKHKDIPHRLAQKYFEQYVLGKQCTAKYQRYPKKDYEEMDLSKKINELREKEKRR